MAGASLLVGGLGFDTVGCRVEVVLGLVSACWWVEMGQGYSRLADK